MNGPNSHQMPAERPGLIAIDIDGTMIRSDQRLAPRVRQALHDAVEAGVHIVPATGRPEAVAQDIVVATDLRDYWIFANGAVTRHVGRDEVVRAFWIDNEVTLRVISEMQETLPSVRLAIEFDKELAYQPGFEKVVPNPLPIPPVDDIAAEVTVERMVQKLLFFDPTVPITELFEQVSQLASGAGVVSYSGLPFIELGAAQVTKGMALDLLATDLGVPPSSTAAFGDNHNDIPMLQWAQTAYVMGNGSPDAQAEADYVIGTNDEDAVAVVIEQLLALPVPNY